MQKLIFEEPYEFIPPHKGRWFTSLFKFVLRPYLRKTHGIVSDEIRGVEKLQASMSAGHGVLLAPNHCRPSDPMAMGLLTIAANTCLHTMASWHVFKQDRLSAFAAHKLGAFSIYREGMDRMAINCSIDILQNATRPLVLFPEGCISRHNDRLGVLMDGTSFIARTAAKRRAKLTPAGKVVIHPVALKYKFLGSVEESLPSVLTEIESRMSWQPQKEMHIVPRIAKVGRALLCLKEVEYLGGPQPGSIYQRLTRLIDAILNPKEEEWLGEKQQGDTVSRVKNLRTAILSGMIQKRLDDVERDRRWKHLADLYLAQQLSFYPKDYIHPQSSPERLLETVERFEEDLTDAARIHGPMKLVIEIGDPIEVSPKRERGAKGDPLMQTLETQLQSMIDRLTTEMAE